MIHIPKTGGNSFTSDGKEVVAPSSFVENYERSWRCTGHHKDQVDVMLFRQPLEHVLSQFLHCKFMKAWNRSPVLDGTEAISLRDRV